MKESIFQVEIKKSIEDAGGWCKKFPDTIRDFKNPDSPTRFIPRKPFDLIAVYKGIPVAIECKQMKMWKALNCKVMQSAKDKRDDLPFYEWNQIKELNEFEQKGEGQSFLFLNIRIASPQENVLIWFPWYELFMIWNAEPTFINKPTLQENFKDRMIPGSKGLFDLTSFYKHIKMKKMKIY